MAGWLIKVPTERMGGGAPIEDLYAVWLDDPVEALSKLEQGVVFTVDQIPETVVEISEAVLRGLGVPPGEARHVITKA